MNTVSGEKGKRRLKGRKDRVGREWKVRVKGGLKGEKKEERGRGREGEKRVKRGEGRKRKRKRANEC